MSKALFNLRSGYRQLKRRVGFILSGFVEDPRWFHPKDWNSFDINWLLVRMAVLSYPLIDENHWSHSDRKRARWRKWISVLLGLQATIRWTISTMLPDLRPWDIDHYLGSICIHLPGAKNLYQTPLIMIGWTIFLSQITFEIKFMDHRWRDPYQVLVKRLRIEDKIANQSPPLSTSNQRRLRHWSLAILWLAECQRDLISGFMIMGTFLWLWIAWPAEKFWPWGVVTAVTAAPWFYNACGLVIGGLGIFIVLMLYISLNIQELKDDIIAAGQRNARFEKLLQRLDAFCSMVHGCNEFWKWIIVLIWSSGTIITDLMLILLLFTSVPFVLRCIFSITVLILLIIIHVFYLGGGLIHTKIMHLYLELNYFTQIRIVGLHDQLSVMNGIERLGGMFIGFTCMDLFDLDLWTYHEIVASTSSNFLLFIDLLSSIIKSASPL